MKELDDFINQVQHLPPAPTILPQLLGLLDKDDIDSSKVVDLISYDPSLTASVLQLSNSAFFGASRPAEDLYEAVTRLGFKEIYKVVTTVLAARALGGEQKGYGLNRGELWKHSVTTAVAAQLIAEDLGDDHSTAYTAGLLHDIGKLVLAQALEHIYGKLVEDVEKNQQSMLEAEKHLLGVQHAEVGGRLLARWRFPANLVAAVWFHHNPAAAAPHQKLTSFVYLGNMIAYFIGHGYGHQAFALRGRSEALEILGITGDDLPKYMIRTLENFETVEALIRAT